jgi:hypothetical protein
MSRRKSYYAEDLGLSIRDKMKELDDQDREEIKERRWMREEDPEIPRADQEDDEWAERLYER